jgi:predicted component of type VI protein secretion system
MSAYIELLTGGVPDRVPVSGERLVIGQASSNDLPLPFDTTVSRLHAVLENLPAGWCIRDLNSRNGTFLNGERLWGEQPLRPGDEIRVGRTTMIFRTDAPTAPEEPTASAEDAPELTRRERDVLLALCAPLMSEDVFHQPASIHDIAGELVVTDAAVKQHLLRLFDKFDIRGPGESRRLQLANGAIRRGAVSMAEIQEWVKRRQAH